jgi:hypothetical protein
MRLGCTLIGQEVNICFILDIIIYIYAHDTRTLCAHVSASGTPLKFLQRAALDPEHPKRTIRRKRAQNSWKTF